MSAAATQEVTSAPPADAGPRVKRFFPDLFSIEALVALGMLVALLVVSALTTAPLEEKASREAAGYVPRPEWYFLWLFQLLKYFKGSLEVVGTTLVPLVLIALLLAAPFIDRREPKTTKLFGRTRPIRVLPRVVAAVAIALLLALTIVAASERLTPTVAPPPAPEWPPQSSGQDVGRSTPHITAHEEARGGDHVRIA